MKNIIKVVDEHPKYILTYEEDGETIDKHVVELYDPINNVEVAPPSDLQVALNVWLAEEDNTPEEAVVDVMLPNLTRVQFFAMIDIIGLTVEQIEQAIMDTDMEDIQKSLAKSKLKNASYYDRTDPMFDLIPGLVGITQEQLDTHWQTASTL